MNMTISDTKYQNICLICMQVIDIDVDRFWRCHSCSQAYHNQHLTIWLESHDYCPTCRKNLQPELIQYYRYFRKIGYNLDKKPYVSKIIDPRVFNIRSNRSPSKSHISYFQMNNSISNESCSCGDWKYSLLDDYKKKTTYGQYIANEVLYYGIRALTLILIILPMIIGLFGITMNLTSKLLLLPLYCLIIVFYITKILSRLYDRLNCPVH